MTVKLLSCCKLLLTLKRKKTVQNLWQWRAFKFTTGEQSINKKHFMQNVLLVGVKSVLQQRLLNDALFKLTLPFFFVASVYNSAFVQREGKFTRQRCW
jgi:hypothetical protein